MPEVYLTYEQDLLTYSCIHFSADGHNGLHASLSQPDEA